MAILGFKTFKYSTPGLHTDLHTRANLHKHDEWLVVQIIFMNGASVREQCCETEVGDQRLCVVGH